MSEDATPQPVEELWLYAGQRLTAAGKLVDAWCPAGGPTTEDKCLWYPPDRAGFVVGGLYRAEVRRHGERVTKLGRPVFQRGNAAPPDVRLEWAARDDVAATLDAAAKAERRAARNGDPVGEALAPLKAVAAKLRTRADRDAFVARVLRELSEAW